MKEKLQDESLNSCVTYVTPTSNSLQDDPLKSITQEIKRSQSLSSKKRSGKIFVMYAILSFAILCTSTGILWFKAQTGTLRQ
jgi:hypothetical protein